MRRNHTTTIIHSEMQPESPCGYVRFKPDLLNLSFVYITKFTDGT